MDDLSSDQLEALRDLARKQSGASVPFVNIAAARALTDLGLATRGGAGWNITGEGVALLARLSDGPRLSDGGNR